LFPQKLYFFSLSHSIKSQQGFLLFSGKFLFDKFINQSKDNGH